jgi:hypothetical protein
LVFAHVRGLDYLDAGGESTPMNLGTEKGFSVREVLAATEKITGITLRKKIVSRRPGDPAVLLADPSRAQRLLQWAPTRSLEEMIESAWKWLQNYRSQPENFKQMPGRVAHPDSRLFVTPLSDSLRGGDITRTPSCPVCYPTFVRSIEMFLQAREVELCPLLRAYRNAGRGRGCLWRCWSWRLLASLACGPP